MLVLIALFYLHVYTICLIQVRPCMLHLFTSHFKWVSINIILWAHNFYLWEFCCFNLLHWRDCPKSVMFLLVCSVMSSFVLTSMVLAVVCPYATLLHWYQDFINPVLGIVIFSANIIVPTITIFYIVLFLCYDLLSVWEQEQTVYTCASPHSSLPFCLRCQDSFLHHFPSSQRIVFGQSARVDVLASCSFIWASLFYIELLHYPFIDSWMTLLSIQYFWSSWLQMKSPVTSDLGCLIWIFAASVQLLWRLSSTVFFSLPVSNAEFLGTSLGMALWESLSFFNMFVCLSSYLNTSLTITNMIKFMSLNSTPISNDLHSTTLARLHIFPCFNDRNLITCSDCDCTQLLQVLHPIIINMHLSSKSTQTSAMWAKRQLVAIWAAGVSSTLSLCLQCCPFNWCIYNIFWCTEYICFLFSESPNAQWAPFSFWRNKRSHLHLKGYLPSMKLIATITGFTLFYLFLTHHIC